MSVTLLLQACGTPARLAMPIQWHGGGRERTP